MEELQQESQGDFVSFLRIDPAMFHELLELLEMCLKQMRQSFKYSQHVATNRTGIYDLLNNNAGRIENVRGPFGARTMLY